MISFEMRTFYDFQKYIIYCIFQQIKKKFKNDRSTLEKEDFSYFFLA